ncbi:MAG: nucleotide exchange factor GrpE [Desulfobacterales bacterium]|jgi:molecular chaperone GrpE
MGKNTIPEDQIGLDMDAENDDPAPPATEPPPQYDSGVFAVEDDSGSPIEEGAENSFDKEENEDSPFGNDGIAISSVNAPDETATEETVASQAEEQEFGVSGDDLPGHLIPIDSIDRRLGDLQDRLESLSQDFEGKLKYDAHKETIIDKLHQELQEYKQDLMKKLVLSFVLDVVKLSDDIRKWITHFKSLEPSQRDPMKLFRYLDAIPSDLDDIFYWQGVKSFCSSDGPIDPARQRALKKIPTDDPELDKTIAHTIRPGYEWEGKVIRQEMVAVYVYSEATE